jgi:serine/threonine-protein kinase
MGRIAQQISKLQPINNVNLVSCDFYEECEGIGYMLMQAIDGIDLQFLVDGKHLELARSRSTDEEWKYFTQMIFRVEDKRVSLRTGVMLHILRDTLRGLSALHEQGFIHGDIKPTNIMINRQGTVKLVDFGRAVRVGEKVNILLGSPLYMAPEVHRREPGCLQADIFSAGLVGLEMLVGRQISALTDYSEDELIDFKIKIAPEIGKWLPPEVLSNTEVTYVLKKMLEPDLNNRFSSAKEVESGVHSFESAHQWLEVDERETDYERALESFLLKLVDEDTGALNPHFGSDNLTAVIIT